MKANNFRQDFVPPAFLFHRMESAKYKGIDLTIRGKARIMEMSRN